MTVRSRSNYEVNFFQPSRTTSRPLRLGLASIMVLVSWYLGIMIVEKVQHLSHVDLQVFSQCKLEVQLVIRDTY